MSSLVEEYEALYDIHGLLDNLVAICHKVNSELNQLDYDDCYLDITAFIIHAIDDLKTKYSYEKMLYLSKKSNEAYRIARGNVAFFISENIKEIKCSFPFLDREVCKKMHCLLALCLYFLDEAFVKPFPYLE